MAENLNIFLSSHQQEFEKTREKLAQLICEIPFLRCLLLEKSGADDADVLEASLKAVRNCDIYVGIFGKYYSEITLKEYEEAVNEKIPCLIYVKKLRKRDLMLNKFIEEELKSRFKFHKFKNKDELNVQIEHDLKKFVLETLVLGLKVRAQNKKDISKIIDSKEQTIPSSNEPFMRAESDFNNQNYLSCIIRIILIMESALKIELGNSLRARSINFKNRTLGQLIQLSEETGVITVNQSLDLQNIAHIKTAAIHQGDFPSRSQTKWALRKAKKIFNSF